MPVSIRGTDILFNDGSTQSTAAGAPSTTQVLNATAGASTGAVGTYAYLYPTFAVTGTNISASWSPGATVAGSGLTYTGSGPGGGSFSAGTPSGTWRVMGRAFTTGADGYGGTAYFPSRTLFLRIS